LVFSFLLDVEVFNLVGRLVGGNDIQKLSQAVLLEIFFGEVFQVSLGEVDVSLDSNPLVVAVDSYGLSEVAGSSCDFDASSEELSEIGGIEDLILNGL
jgi:hypothetical protein